MRLLASTWLSLHQSAPYVTAAYLVFLAVILIYVVIMARRMIRNQRELETLRAEFEAHRAAAAEAEREAHEPEAVA